MATLLVSVSFVKSEHGICPATRLIVVTAWPGRSSLGCEIYRVEAEPFGKPFAPLEVVEQGPVEVAADVMTLLNFSVEYGQVVMDELGSP